MTVVQDYAVYFLAMAALAVASAFFSCSEAALFSLRPDDRRALRRGNLSQRAAIELLNRPERLLSSILFCNLMVNTLYFVLTSIISVQLQHAHRGRDAGVVATIAMFALVAFGEMGPKIVGVQSPRVLASLLSLPLTIAVRVLDPIMPTLSTIDRWVRRFIAPRFAAEPYLEISDLERAISLSTTDAQLVAREQMALQNIIQLSDLTAEELMRPRKQYVVFKPPVSLDDLRTERPDSGYALITEADSDEIAAAISLKLLAAAPKTRLEMFAKSVVYVPWCSAASIVLEQLRRQQRDVAAVVNEFGETIGIITEEDLLESIFEVEGSRSARLLATSSIAPAGDDRWIVTGITNLRRISRQFGVPLESIASVTVAGMLQEVLQKIPEPGDEADWSGFHFMVLEAPEDGPLKVELRLASNEGAVP